MKKFISEVQKKGSFFAHFDKWRKLRLFGAQIRKKPTVTSKGKSNSKKSIDVKEKNDGGTTEKDRKDDVLGQKSGQKLKREGAAQHKPD